jgi:hypothetical protein
MPRERQIALPSSQLIGSPDEVASNADAQATLTNVEASANRADDRLAGSESGEGAMISF